VIPSPGTCQYNNASASFSLLILLLLSSRDLSFSPPLPPDLVAAADVAVAAAAASDNGPRGAADDNLDAGRRQIWDSIHHLISKFMPEIIPGALKHEIPAGIFQRGIFMPARLEYTKLDHWYENHSRH
jgi:hypothetical protein